jgi:hypothetical protein
MTTITVEITAGFKPDRAKVENENMHRLVNLKVEHTNDGTPLERELATILISYMNLHNILMRD